MPVVGSPLLDDYDRTGIITPGLQRALDMTRDKLGSAFQFDAPASANAPAQLPGAAMISPGQSAPASQRPNAPAMPSSATPMAAQPQPQPSAHQQELTRLTTGPTGKSGIEQIHNPWLRTPLRILDALGSAFEPALTAALPGTQLHHRGLVNQAAGNVERDEKTATEEANRAHMGAETSELGARAQHESAEAERLAHPTDSKEWQQSSEPEVDPEHPEIGPQAVWYNKSDPTQKHFGGAPVAAKPGVAAKPDIHAMYADAVADALHRGVEPAKDPKVKQLSDAIQEAGRQPAPKEPARDDRAIAIYSKPADQRSAEENAYLKGYEMYVDKTKIQPGVDRMTVMMSGRPVQIIDPDNPENVRYTTAGEAIKSGAASPSSIPFQTDKGVTKAFTSGTESRTLNAFNTAHAHLSQLEQAASGLKNGDIQLVNRAAQAFAQATGSAAPVKFDAIREAVLGEVSKTFKGGQATEGEINALRSTISRAQSPDQLAAGIAAYRQLMESKRGALEKQYEAGKEGRPNFGEAQPTGFAGGVTLDDINKEVERRKKAKGK